MTSNASQPSQFGASQWRFIKKTRSAIDNDGKSFFAANNWRNITPAGGKHDSNLLNVTTRKWSVESFYVKAVACWVPHILIAHHVPCCPHCRRSDQVDVLKARWLNCPKILYGISSHRYLDTLLYPCGRCRRRFAGYNKQSMELDAKVYYGFFPFYLGHSYAVDEQLYRHVIEQSATDATAMIARRLRRTSFDHYFEEYQLYLSAVGVNKIQRKKPRKTITSMMPRAPDDPELSRLMRRRNDKSRNVVRIRLDLLSVQAKLGADCDFSSLLGDKDNHNVHGSGNILSGLGSTKLRKLISYDICSMWQLLAIDPEDARYQPIMHLLPRWQNVVLDYYQQLQSKADELAMALSDAENEYEIISDQLQQYESSHAPPEVADNPPNADDGTNNNTRPPLFSKFDDRNGYNGRVLSKYRIDSIVTTGFNHRKAFIESKMQGLLASILKIDFNYKLASKIRVWTKQGNSFSPFQCIVTIQNQDALTVFWKALKHSESFSEIFTDLKRVRRRLNQNNKLAKLASRRTVAANNEELGPFCGFCGPTEQAVKVIYVDNCCNVHRILKRAFPGCLVKLDVFHWMKRWNEIMEDNKSPQAGVFRALLHRAVFNVEPREFARAKAKLRLKTGKEPTTKEILRAANSVIPEPSILRANVEAVYNYCVAKDSEADVLLSTLQEGDTETPRPKRFFKSSNAKQRKHIQELFKHINRGCLSDPPSHLVNIHRYNPVTDTTHVARGTNTNERDNLDLAHRILTATHIGIHRAERLICLFFEERNHHKMITRLGAVDHGTFHTEKLLLLNSYAHTLGYDKEKLPFAEVSAPTESLEKEYMGFSYQPPTVDNISNPTDTNRTSGTDINHDDEAEENNDGSEDAPSESDVTGTVRTLIGDDLDVEVLVDEEEYVEATRNDYVETQLRQIEDAQAAAASDRLSNHATTIRNEIRRLLPENKGNETTLQAFGCLSNSRPWIPFRPVDSTTPPTEIDVAEAALFNQWIEERKYSVAAQGGRTSYEAFERDWNNEVSRRFKEWSSGNDDIVQIRLKSRQQLLEHNEKIQQMKSLQATAPTENDPARDQLNQQLHASRQQLPVTVAAHHCQAPVFVHNPTVTPFGNPATMNTAIAVHAVQDPVATTVNGRVVAPFRMSLPNIADQPSPRPTRKVFRSKKYCIVCGWRKNEHTPEEGKGGVDRRGNKKCKRDYCGNCFQLRNEHTRKGIRFGPECPMATNPFCSNNVQEWYEFKVSYCYCCHCFCSRHGIQDSNRYCCCLHNSELSRRCVCWLDCMVVDLCNGPVNVLKATDSH